MRINHGDMKTFVISARTSVTVAVFPAELRITTFIIVSESCHCKVFLIPGYKNSLPGSQYSKKLET